MTSQRYCEKGTSLNRFGRRLGNVGQQVMLNKLALTFQVIYDVTMTSQRYCEKALPLIGLEGDLALLDNKSKTKKVHVWYSHDVYNR